MKKELKRTLINIAITIVFGFVYFYLKLPAINLQDPDFYGFIILMSIVYMLLTLFTLGLLKTNDSRELLAGIRANCKIPALICIVLVLVMLIGTLVGAPLFRARSYSNLLQIETGDFLADVEEVNYEQIPMLDEASAKKLGDRKMGELAEYVSQFEVSNDYTQINYNGRPVRVTSLVYGDAIKWLTNRSRGIPAYLIIDMVTQNVEVVRLPEGIKYTTAEHFSRDLTRHLRFNFPTYMFDEATFEIDDDGVPYWVCPRVVRRIGLFGGTDICGAVLVNAITGESKYYADGEIPTWVDRVFTADLIIEQYDYYGTYSGGFWNSIFGQRNVTVTTDGSAYLAIGDDVYMYTGITSVMSDESNIGFILANQRTKATRFYAIAGAEEYSAEDSAEGIVQHLGYDATFPLLLNISGEPTYFMALKDSAGLVKMYAMVNVQQYQIVATGVTVLECERAYLALLSSGGLGTGESLVQNEVSGFVADVKTAVIDGNTHVYIRLTGRDFYYIISVSDAPTAALVELGDRVKLTVSDSEGELVSAFDIAFDRG